jgi:hypothetical protein
MRVLGPHGSRPQHRRFPCASLGLHRLHQSPHGTMPLLLPQSFPARQGRHLQLHWLGNLLGKTPLPHRPVLAPPIAPAPRPVEPMEPSLRRPQQLRQTCESRPLRTLLHQPLFHPMGQLLAFTRERGNLDRGGGRAVRVRRPGERLSASSSPCARWRSVRRPCGGSSGPRW